MIRGREKGKNQWMDETALDVLREMSTCRERRTLVCTFESIELRIEHKLQKANTVL